MMMPSIRKRSLWERVEGECGEREEKSSGGCSKGKVVNV